MARTKKELSGKTKDLLDNNIGSLADDAEVKDIEKESALEARLEELFGENSPAPSDEDKRMLYTYLKDLGRSDDEVTQMLSAIDVAWNPATGNNFMRQMVSNAIGSIVRSHQQAKRDDDTTTAAQRKAAKERREKNISDVTTYANEHGGEFDASAMGNKEVDQFGKTARSAGVAEAKAGAVDAIKNLMRLSGVKAGDAVPMPGRASEKSREGATDVIATISPNSDKKVSGVAKIRYVTNKGGTNYIDVPYNNLDELKTIKDSITAIAGYSAGKPRMQADRDAYEDMSDEDYAGLNSMLDAGDWQGLGYNRLEAKAAIAKKKADREQAKRESEMTDAHAQAILNEKNYSDAAIENRAIDAKLAALAPTWKSKKDALEYLNKMAGPGLFNNDYNERLAKSKELLNKVQEDSVKRYHDKAAQLFGYKLDPDEDSLVSLGNMGGTIDSDDVAKAEAINALTRLRRGAGGNIPYDDPIYLALALPDIVRRLGIYKKVNEDRISKGAGNTDKFKKYGDVAAERQKLLSAILNKGNNAILTRIHNRGDKTPYDKQIADLEKTLTSYTSAKGKDSPESIHYGENYKPRTTKEALAERIKMMDEMLDNRESDLAANRSNMTEDAVANMSKRNDRLFLELQRLRRQYDAMPDYSTTEDNESPADAFLNMYEEGTPERAEAQKILDDWLADTNAELQDLRDKRDNFVFEPTAHIGAHRLPTEYESDDNGTRDYYRINGNYWSNSRLYPDLTNEDFEAIADPRTRSERVKLINARRIADTSKGLVPQLTADDVKTISLITKMNKGNNLMPNFGSLSYVIKRDSEGNPVLDKDGKVVKEWRIATNHGGVAGMPKKNTGEGYAKKISDNGKYDINLMEQATAEQKAADNLRKEKATDRRNKAKVIAANTGDDFEYVLEHLDEYTNMTDAEKGALHNSALVKQNDKDIAAEKEKHQIRDAGKVARYYNNLAKKAEAVAAGEAEWEGDQEERWNEWQAKKASGITDDAFVKSKTAHNDKNDMKIIASLKAYVGDNTNKVKLGSKAMNYYKGAVHKITNSLRGEMPDITDKKVQAVFTPKRWAQDYINGVKDSTDTVRGIFNDSARQPSITAAVTDTPPGYDYNDVDTTLYGHENDDPVDNMHQSEDNK